MTILELHGVSTHFGGLPAVDGVDLEIARGTTTALIGPNGAGKSTLLRTICGLHTPSGGRVVVDGTDVTGLPAHVVRRHGVALVVQTPRSLAGMTVRDSVALGAMFGTPGGRRGARESRGAADEALDLVGLGGRGASAADHLTVHERRRVELARALAGNPRLLLLDEVLAGLTPVELDGAVALVQEIAVRADVTVVLVEHVVRAVHELAESVVVLDHGRVLAVGDPAAVMRDEQVVTAYLGTAAADGTDVRRASPPSGGRATRPGGGPP